MEAQSEEPLTQPFTSGSLTERRRGNGREFHLPTAKCQFLVVQIKEGAMNGAQFRDPRNFPLASGGERGQRLVAGQGWKRVDGNKRRSKPQDIQNSTSAQKQRT